MTPERDVVVGLRAADPLELTQEVTMRPLFGDRRDAQPARVAPGAQVAVHDHPHEQLGYVLEGELALEIDGVEHRLHPGDAYRIAGGTPHGAWSDGTMRRPRRLAAGAGGLPAAERGGLRRHSPANG